ncbi:cardiolipin synthase [Spiroplasma eriocheiris]|uniref:Cardiolipin synthase n=1 Tax=Spiroplasma eriocheiris TaxID=315358 RepID=A0A0H3XIE8_9MOLU|nr:cardiolipin synthase [Spiroplasma eriocheiris]AHF58223.1 putative cardiolipin synthetase [Spiroplasma eriocheiris CCTCC M 207170]AKM54658.1 cardiolipin synthetase [Spiroplasma eriocheiris]
MKNWLKIILSMMFLFGLAVAAVVVVAIIFNIAFIWIFVSILIIDFLMAFWIFFSKRRYEVKLSWIIFVIFIPFIGLCSYIFFGRKYHFSNKRTIYYEAINKNEYQQFQEDNLANLTKINTLSPHFTRTFELLNHKAEKPVYGNSAVEILPNGTIAFYRILSDLQKAKKYILLTYFIIADGELFEAFAEIIKELLKAGVKVYLIYDHVGSYFKISEKSLRKLKKIGVKMYKFLPIITPFLNGNANYRNHRKDVVIDGKIGYTGGINLSDLYVNQSPKFGLFHDVQLRIEGDGVRALEVIFADDWYFASKQRERISELENDIFTKKDHHQTNNTLVQIFNDYPSFSESLNRDAYISLINNAKKRIWLSTPYFIAPGELILALKTAAQAGIDVRLTIPGLTDKIFVLDITKTYCKELLAVGVKIYEMNNVFCHNKIAIFDDEIAIVGTCNLDYRSFFSDHQTTAIIYDKEVVKTFLTRWEWDYNHAILWREWPIKYKPLKYRVGLQCLKLVSPIL